LRSNLSLQFPILLSPQEILAPREPIHRLFALYEMKAGQALRLSGKEKFHVAKNDVAGRHRWARDLPDVWPGSRLHSLTKKFSLP
jgi:hypothetical protein